MTPYHLKKVKRILADLVEAWGMVKKPKHFDTLLGAYWQAEFTNDLERAAEVRQVVESFRDKDDVVKYALVPAIQVLEQCWGSVRASSVDIADNNNIDVGSVSFVRGNELGAELLGEAETMLAHLQQRALLSYRKSQGGARRGRSNNELLIRNWCDMNLKESHSNNWAAHQIFNKIRPTKSDGTFLGLDAIKKHVGNYRKKAST